MIALIQRVSRADVQVDGQRVAAIGPGMLCLIGVRRGDEAASAERLLERLLTYRIFSDDQGRMNRSLQDIDGGLLLVPQFTLAADTHKGTRPGFSTAAAPGEAQRLFDHLVERAGATHPGLVQTGIFGANMQVSLVNDGPVTFWLETPATSVHD